MKKENYVAMAKILVERNQDRLDKDINPKQQEVDQLFMWLMMRLGSWIESYGPASNEYDMRIKEAFNRNNLVALKDGEASYYHSRFVLREEFYQVMQTVVAIINDIGVVNGYSFSASCRVPMDINSEYELKSEIRLELKKVNY